MMWEYRIGKQRVGWEYMVIEREFEMEESELNKIGRNGWELVAIVVKEGWQRHEASHFFKRAVSKND